jgi:hypothetical protein
MDIEYRHALHFFLCIDCVDEMYSGKNGHYYMNTPYVDTTREAHS